MEKIKDNFGETVSISILNASEAAKFLNGPWNLENFTNRSNSFGGFYRKV
jgi:maltose-binding protein MalE